MVYYPSVTRLLPLTTVRRERILPVEGEVLVSAGARVESMSVVARANVPGRYVILNVAQALRLAPDAADKRIALRPGQSVNAGQAVANRRIALGLVPRVVRVPQAGVVVAVGGGRVLLETAGQPIELRAFLPGRVENVLSRRGVLVETIGALIQGVWGVGGESFGVLKVLVEQPDEPLRARSIDVSCHGAVLVGGTTVDQDGLQQALELQVRGIIVGSLSPATLETARRMPFPVVATEGLGQAAMAQPVFQLLRTNEGREAAISGRTQLRWGAVRPEVVIPLPARSASLPPSPDTPLTAGLQVRVVRGPLTGAVGKVERVPSQPSTLETGARVWGAVVTFAEGEQHFIPNFNLELLG